MPKIKVKGLKELEKSLKSNATLNDVRRVVRNNGAKLHEKAQDNADFKGHYAYEKGKGLVFKEASGTLKRSIALDIIDGGLTAKVEPTVEYGAYVECGTRFMDAQPYLQPSIDDVEKKFKKDLKKLVK